MTLIYPRWLVHLLRRPAVTAFPRRPDPEAPARSPDVSTRQPLFARSLAIRHVDAGSCNAPESELALLASPVYDLSRMGFRFTPSPRHADILLVTGVVTEGMVPFIRAAYEAMPAPKLVVAVGDCAAGGCVFAGLPGVVGDLGRVVPVAARIPGCPPTPNDVLAGLMAVVDRRPAAVASR